MDKILLFMEFVWWVIFPTVLIGIFWKVYSFSQKFVLWVIFPIVLIGISWTVYLFSQKENKKYVGDVCEWCGKTVNAGEKDDK